MPRPSETGNSTPPGSKHQLSVSTGEEELNPYDAPVTIPPQAGTSSPTRLPGSAWLLLFFPPAWAVSMVWVASWMTRDTMHYEGSTAWLLGTVGALAPAVSVALMTCGALVRHFVLQLALLVLELLVLVYCWSVAFSALMN